MSRELSPENEVLEVELAKINSPSERAAFLYFYDQTQKEGLQVLPQYTFDQFAGGLAPVYDVGVDSIRDFVQRTDIIPNYSRQIANNHGLTDTVPLTEALQGPFNKMLEHKRAQSAVRVMAIHPSLATPYVIAAAINEAHIAETGEDIREFIHIVVGAYPAVMKYSMRLKDNSEIKVSPVEIGRMLGNLVLTAPKTANTETEEVAVQAWMNATRATFKLRNQEILNQPGNILIVHPSGRRGQRTKWPPFRHKEYRPDSSLGYITDIPVPTFIVGVDDNLLNDPAQPNSIVSIVGNPFPRILTKDKHVIDALKHSAELSSVGKNKYILEGRVDHAMRLGKKAIGSSVDIEA